MKNKLSLSVFVSVALLLYLLLSNIGRLDLSPSKMNAVVKMNKFDIQEMQNIDSVKSEAFELLDLTREKFRRDSKTGSTHIIVVLILIAIQLLLLKMANRRLKANSKSA